MTAKPTPATPELPRLIKAEPDLVDRIFEYLLSEYPQIAGMPADQLAKIKADVRAEFRGEECYIAERPATARQQMVSQILSLFNGRNASEVARRLQISRATVYRAIKQPGQPNPGGRGPKKQSQIYGT